MLLVHVSNRFLDLSPVLAQHAHELGLHAFHLDELRALSPAPGFRPWTDRYANLAGLLN